MSNAKYRVGERIFMLDCARKYFTPEWMKSQRDVLYAYNAKVIKSETLPAEINPYTSPLDKIWEIEFAG